MKKLLIPFCALALVMTACQKEPSFEDLSRTPGSGGGGNTNGAKLVRLGARFGTDSLTTDFSYNAAGRITLISYSGTIDNEPAEIQQIVNRDAGNVIKSMALKSPFFTGAGFNTDSLVTRYDYDAAKGQYIRGVSHFVLEGEAQADSVVFTYDNAGKLASAISYFADSSGYEPDGKVEYTYSGNNLASKKTYAFDGRGFALDETETYEYDDKVNPQQAVIDAPILDVVDFFPANNKKKRTTVTTDPAGTVVTNVVYTYNSDNRPIKAVGTAGAVSSTVSYYYQ